METSDPDTAQSSAQHSAEHVEEQTQPIAMVAVVAGLGSVAFGVICCLDPRLAAITHALLGTLAVGCGATTWARVQSGRYDESNKFQARLGLALGAVGLILAMGWGLWILQHPDGR